MTIEFHCPDCDKVLRTTDDKAGQAAKCPSCACSLIVPTLDQTASTVDTLSGFSRLENQGQSVSQELTCPVCGGDLSIYDTVCPHCGENQPGHIEPLRYHRQDNSLAIVSLVTGTLSLVLYCCLNVMTFPIALAAVITGIISLRRTIDGRGLAIAGICCGSVSLLVTFAYIAFIAVMVISSGL